MKLHIEFDVELNDQWSNEFKNLFPERAIRARYRMRDVLVRKFLFGKISGLEISPKDSEV